MGVNNPKSWQRIHTSTVDDKHQIEVWENSVTKARYWIPYYSRTGRSWSEYISHGRRIACTSYASAMKHIQHNNRDRPARRRTTVAQQDATHYIW